MKKQIKYIVTSIIIVLCCFLYAHIDKAHSIYDVKADSDTYIGVNLGENDKVMQMFVCPEENLDGISVKAAVNADSAAGKLTYVLQDADEREVRSGIVPFENIKSGKMNKIKFDERVEESKGKTYTIIIGVTDIKEGESIDVYYVPQKAENSLYITEQKIDGSLIFRTVTHRFDLETFIMILGFVVYLSVFFRILYKLFS